MEELSIRHDFLSADHERLTYDYLKRKQELESLREAIQNSILAQQLKERYEVFIPPCLTCLECNNAETNTESSDTIERNASTTDVVANPSLEESTIISDGKKMLG
jgi:hypothetical protein